MVLVVDPSLRDLSGFRRGAQFKAKRGGHGEGANRHGATPDVLEIRVPPGTVVEDTDSGDRWDLLAPGERAVIARGGRRWARQPPVRHPHAPESALCRARAARRGAHARAAPQALRRRRPDRAAERGQVLADSPAHARTAQGGRLSVHDPRAGARHARARRPPARDRRHPRADRGRQRRRRARPRVPRSRRALPAAGARARPEPARRLGPAGELRDRRGRASRARARPGRAPAPARPLEGGPRAARGGGRGGGALARPSRRGGDRHLRGHGPGAGGARERHLQGRAAGGASRGERRDARHAQGLPAGPRRRLPRRAHADPARSASRASGSSG